MSVVLLCVTAVVLVGAVLYWNSRTNRQGRSVFRQRPDMTIENIHRSFYAGSTVSLESLEAAVAEISRILGVRATRLRPSDRFAIELAPEPGWEFDDPLGELSAIAERKLRRAGLDSKAVKDILTVDDYVRLTSGCVGVQSES